MSISIGPRPAPGVTAPDGMTPPDSAQRKDSPIGQPVPIRADGPYLPGTRYTYQEMVSPANREVMIANISEDIRSGKAQVQPLMDRIDALSNQPLTTIAALDNARKEISALQEDISRIENGIKFAEKQINYLSGGTSSYDGLLAQMNMEQLRR